ncbi:MAG TPA: hypothetical protein VLT89_02110 [Usitatibacter sp.]|nr:hypothetical protein [Usitatibacter sp.]
MSPDPTGLWFDPAQPGWGASITQQGGNVFIALFVYDAEHNPTWYVASNVSDHGQGNFLTPQVFNGPLYRSTGPAFSLPGDPTRLSVEQVGTIQVAYLQTPDPSTLRIALTYSVGATQVSKVIQPLAWADNRDDLAGNYIGSIYVTPQCGFVPIPWQAPNGFSITANGDGYDIAWSTGIDTGCRSHATYTNQGLAGALSGALQCGPIPDPVAMLGVLSIAGIHASPDGLTGSVTLAAPGCTYTGSIGGMKRQ